MSGPLDDSDLDLETIIEIAAAAEADAIATMGEAFSRQWEAECIRTASSGGNPLTTFIAMIRARHPPQK